MDILRYKRCGKFILVLKVTSDDHNEDRMVANNLRACYRCSKVLVIDILDFNKQQSNNALVKCDFNPKIIFRKDKETFSKYIPSDKASGIEYFKTFEGAFFRSTIPPGNNSIGLYNGMWYTYYEDGSMHTKGKYNKGLPVGIHYVFNKDGDITEIEEFSDNGILIRKGSIDKGNKIGTWVYYNDSGKMCCISSYDIKKRKLC